MKRSPSSEEDLFKIADDEWDKLLSSKWFPFISLRGETIRQMLAHVRAGLDVDELLPAIRREIEARLSGLVERCQKNPIVSGHAAIVETAVKRYLEGDFVSAVSILFPRVEGIMRSFQLAQSPDRNASQHSLVDTAIAQSEPSARPFSLLLPKRFQQYLAEVYFADFDPSGDKPLSRHSVAHGVATLDEFSEKGATIGFLALDQLLMYLRTDEAPPST